MTPIRRRYRYEHVLLTGFDRIVNALPHKMAAGLGVFAAGLTHFVFRLRVREAQRRIRIVFGDRLAPRAVRRIAWQSWRNIALCGVDTMRAARINDSWFYRNMGIADLEQRIRSRVGNDSGAVMACAHIGSWELAAVASCRAGLPIFAIAAPQKNPYFNKWMIALRGRSGIDTLLRGDPNLIRQVVRRLKAGQFLAILPDVRTAGGIPVPFLGAEAYIGPGMALFARMAGVPVLPCLTFRRQHGRHEIIIKDPVMPDPECNRDDDIRRITLTVMQTIDAAIRREPQQWFWYNKRWILDPVT